MSTPPLPTDAPRLRPNPVQRYTSPLPIPSPANSQLRAVLEYNPTSVVGSPDDDWLPDLVLSEEEPEPQQPRQPRTTMAAVVVPVPRQPAHDSFQQLTSSLSNKIRTSLVPLNDKINVLNDQLEGKKQELAALLEGGQPDQQQMMDMFELQGAIVTLTRKLEPLQKERLVVQREIKALKISVRNRKKRKFDDELTREFHAEQGTDVIHDRDAAAGAALQQNAMSAIFASMAAAMGGAGAGAGGMGGGRSGSPPAQRARTSASPEPAARGRQGAHVVPLGGGEAADGFGAKRAGGATAVQYFGNSAFVVLSDDATMGQLKAKVRDVFKSSMPRNSTINISLTKTTGLVLRACDPGGDAIRKGDFYYPMAGGYEYVHEDITGDLQCGFGGLGSGAQVFGKFHRINLQGDMMVLCVLQQLAVTVIRAPPVVKMLHSVKADNDRNTEVLFEKVKQVELNLGGVLAKKMDALEKLLSAWMPAVDEKVDIA